jgi:hypothetical protein
MVVVTSEGLIRVDDREGRSTSGEIAISKRTFLMVVSSQKIT